MQTHSHNASLSPYVIKKTEKLFPRCYKYWTNRTSALHSEAWSSRADRWSSQYSCRRTGYLLCFLPPHIYTYSCNKMPKCPKCQKEVYFGKFDVFTLISLSRFSDLTCTRAYLAFLRKSVSGLIKSSRFCTVSEETGN